MVRHFLVTGQLDSFVFQVRLLVLLKNNIDISQYEKR